MKKDTKIIFRGAVRFLYPVISLVGLQGAESLSPKLDPIILAQVKFRMDEVAVGVFSSDSDKLEEVNLTIYDGLPDLDDLPSGKFCTGGLIKVGDKGLTLNSGGHIETVFSWPRGITAVYVVLEAFEATKNEVHNVTFFVKHVEGEGKRQRIREFFGL